MLVVYLVCSILGAFASYSYLLVLQSTGYKPQRGYYWIVKSVWFWIHLCCGLAVGTVGLHWHVGVIVLFVTAVIQLIKRRKVKLVFTKKIVRMLFALSIVNGIVCYLLGEQWLILSLPILVLIAWIITLPLESLINFYYISKARKKIKCANIPIIAITGSYGKTSTKDMLASLLNDSIAPAGSCNTPLGIAKFINNSNLNNVKYLILEFGARQKWDIKKLCKLFPPYCGVLTGVCNQHLSTFGSKKNIIIAKQQLPLCIKMQGFCVLNSASNAVEIGNIGSCKKIESQSDVKVTLKKIDFNGSYFDVNYKGKSVDVALSQIAIHAGDTLAMALTVCLELGQSFEQTINNISKIQQTAHRMETKQCGSFYIVDDSYNANLVGVESCAKTLSHFCCTKVVITQGIVECGKDRENQNIQCGKLLADCVDVAITLGANCKYLTKGLIQGGCKTVLCANSLQHAVLLARKYVGNGLLIFQNDLPDSVNIM